RKAPGRARHPPWALGDDAGGDQVLAGIRPARRQQECRQADTQEKRPHVRCLPTWIRPTTRASCHSSATPRAPRIYVFRREVGGQRLAMGARLLRYWPRRIAPIRPCFFHAKAMLPARLGVAPVNSCISFVVKVSASRSYTSAHAIRPALRPVSRPPSRRSSRSRASTASRVFAN